MAEHLVTLMIHFMVAADTDAGAVEIAQAFGDNAIDVALWERGGGIRWATPEEQWGDD